MTLRVALLTAALATAAVYLGACGGAESEPAPTVRQRELSASAAVSLVGEAICPNNPDGAASFFRAIFLVDTWAVTATSGFEARFSVIDSTAQVVPEDEVAQAMLEGDPEVLPPPCQGTPVQLPTRMFR